MSKVRLGLTWSFMPAHVACKAQKEKVRHLVSTSVKSRLLLCSPAATATKSLQSCPTLCDPIDDSPRGSPVPGILQAKTLEWVAIAFSNA